MPPPLARIARSGTVLLGLLGIAAIGLGLASCSSTSSYEILSFFFDGVPNPNAPPEPEPKEPARDPRRAEAAQPRPTPAVVHRPVREKRCSECHGTRRGGSIFMGQPRMLGSDSQLCFQCHQLAEREYQHAPAVAGLCTRCHHPHQSEHPRLLLEAKVADLCRACHSAETFATQQEHEARADRDCHSCHDPHASNARYFLLQGHEDEKTRQREPSVQLRPEEAAK